MAVETASDQPFRGIPKSGRANDPMSKGFFTYAPNETWKPNVNLYETDTAYLVCVDLAGVTKSEIDLAVEGQTLRIRGTRAEPTPDEVIDKQRLRVHLMEIDYGKFSRDVELPANVKKEGISAKHCNGMLWIELPKKTH